MNSSYKIVLFVTIILCGLILGYYMTQDDQNQPPTLDGDTADVVLNDSQTTQRPTLRDSSPGAANNAVIPPPAANTSRPPAPAASSSPSGSSASSASSSSTGSLLDSVNARTQGSAAPIAPPPAPAIPAASGNTNTSPVTSDPRSISQSNNSPAPSARTNRATPVDRNPSRIPDTGRAALRNNTPTTGRTYTIKPGDTLSSIAEKTLGSESQWRAIGEANPYLDPRRLKVGQTIQIPDPQASNTTSSSNASSTAAGPLEYVVREGDTLSRIARMHYSDPNLWDVIYRANRALIGSNPTGIRPGMKLFIPPQPTAAH